MSYQMIKTNFYCVGGRHHSITVLVEGYVTEKGKDNLICTCGQRDTKKSMIVTDNTLAAGGLGKLFKNTGKSSAKVSKKLATYVIINPARGLMIEAKVGGESVSKIPKAVSSSIPDVIAFYHTCKRVYIGKFVWIEKLKTLYRYQHKKQEILSLYKISTNCKI